MSKRKIVQIALEVFGNALDIKSQMHVLCNDGTAWYQDSSGRWHQLDTSGLEKAWEEEEKRDD